MTTGMPEHELADIVSDADMLPAEQLSMAEIVQAKITGIKQEAAQRVYLLEVRQDLYNNAKLLSQLEPRDVFVEGWHTSMPGPDAIYSSSWRKVLADLVPMLEMLLTQPE